MTRTTAPEAPGRLGEAIPAADLLAYLAALETWLDERRTELDRLDAAAQAAATPDVYTADLVLALSLWQAIRTRADEIRPVWDSGRADAVAREKISQLVWGRLDSGSGAALVSLVEAVKLCDALVVQLRTRLSFDPHTADQVARLRGVRAELVRCEDLAGSDADARGRVETLRGRLDHLVAQAARGADVAGPLAELETEVARAERDLIVASAQRRELRRDRARTEEQREALEAREPALRELVARCRREIAHPPRLPGPDSRFELDAYAARLATVARAVETVEDAYTRPLRERAELRYSLERLAAKARANGRSASPTVRSGHVEARDAVEAVPCDVTLARFLVEQYQFLTRDLPTPEGASS
ncbi:hypothetical protein [Cellulosimicrobium cellulans]|uniref:hypothetical protein n=1 Tax=Cellulosimicrobium cellulans TaxID=1710 RepID=UPI0006A7EAED|nr:hypothetical protein [Cellulosimicrobium cellulans]